MTLGLRIVLLAIGMATAGVAIVGLIRGSVYCKGGPYARATQPLAFWASVLVYFLWTGMMSYFALR